MPRSAPVDGFALEYDRAGSGPPVVALHGSPGDRNDWAAGAYSADAQAESVCALIEEVELERPVIAGYDLGSRVAQAVARRLTDDVRALVVAPPLPGIGARILEPEAQREFWYQAFHQLELSTELVDGDARGVRAYLTHFWTHWSGPGFTPNPGRFEALVGAYARPGAFAASIAWYRAGGDGRGDQGAPAGARLSRRRRSTAPTASP